MRYIRILSVCLVAVVLASTSAFAAGEAIGTIKSVKGDSVIVRDGQRLTAKLGGDVFQNDVLITGPGGAMGVTFLDKTRVSVGSKTELTLNEFVYSPKKNVFSFVARITKGTLSYISGDIAKKSPESVSVLTPVATIGVRGTSFVVKIDESGV